MRGNPICAERGGYALTSIVPATKSSRWLIIGAVSAVATTLLFWLARFVVLGQPWTAIHAFRFFLFCLIVSAVAGVTGWLGARWLAVALLAGHLLGLLLMALAARGSTGWEDLASLLVYLELLAIGFALGIVIELGRLIRRKAGRRGG